MDYAPTSTNVIARPALASDAHLADIGLYQSDEEIWAYVPGSPQHVVSTLGRIASLRTVRSTAWGHASWDKVSPGGVLSPFNDSPLGEQRSRTVVRTFIRAPFHPGENLAHGAEDVQDARWAVDAKAILLHRLVTNEGGALDLLVTDTSWAALRLGVSKSHLYNSLNTMRREIFLPDFKADTLVGLLEAVPETPRQAWFIRLIKGGFRFSDVEERLRRRLQGRDPAA